MTREEKMAILKDIIDGEIINPQVRKDVGEWAIKALEQGSTTKKDLGVDCISRKAVIDELKRYFHDEYYPRTSIQDCRDCFIEDVLNHLPSVTPQEPRKGHWIEQIDHEENCRTLICSNCDRPALHDGDSIWKHKFCPHCGADMREVEE